MPLTRSPNLVSWFASRCDRFTARLDDGFARGERRFGAWGVCLLFATMLLCVAALYSAPAIRLVNHGILYGEASRAPFEASASPIRFRPLAPVLAYCMFLRGDAFIVLPLLAGIGFLAVVMRGYRRSGFAGSECVAMGSLLAFSSPILFTLHFAGYVDTLSYLVLAIAMIFAGSDLVVGACVALAILNHEANAFLLPWLVWHTGRRREGWARRARLGVSIAAALFLAAYVRAVIARHAPITWTPGFYLNAPYLRENALLNVRGAWLGLFMAFKCLWVLPLLAGVDQWAKGRRAEVASLLLATLGGVATLIITSDESRLPAIAFPAILSGAALLREVVAPPIFGRVLWALLLVNLLVPQYYVGQSRPVVLYPLPVALGLKALGYDPWADWLGQRKMHFSQE